MRELNIIHCWIFARKTKSAKDGFHYYGRYLKNDVDGNIQTAYAIVGE